MIRFLIAMPELMMRENLFYIFRLSCLCLTAGSPELPAVRFPGVDCGDPRSGFFHVIMPSPSYFVNVPDNVSICISEVSLRTYRDLESQFSSGNVAGDPWSHVNSFGKANFQRF